MLLYVYDIKVKDRKALAAVKRRFYYHLKKMKCSRRTKSILLVDDAFEKEFDSFFADYEGYIEVYKIRATSIEKILSLD